MRSQSACRHRQPQQEPPLPPSPSPGGRDTCHPSHRQQRSSSGGSWGLLLFLFLAAWVSSCKGAPVASHVLQGEQDLHLWNEINDMCSAYLARDTQPQSSSALEELCFMVLGLLQKMEVFDKKESTKREELRIPGGIQSRGYFVFRPRNGRRSATSR